MHTNKNQTKKQDTGYTQVVNKLLNNPNISLKAKGLYAYIYSKPDGWDFSSKRMQTQHQDGYRAILAGIKELEDSNYIDREKHADGRITYHILVEPDARNRHQATCLLYTSPSPRDRTRSRMPSSA